MSQAVFLAVAGSLAYLIGSTPFGYLVARSRGVDILSHGSGNIGATNVGRILGRPWGLLVFALDFAKGAIPVLLAMRLAGAMAPELPGEVAAITAGVASFLGHLFPVFLRLRGGKGVATAAGVAVVLLPGPALLAFAAWTVVVVSTRIVSLSSMTAGLVFLGLYLTQQRDAWAWPRAAVTLFCLALVTLIFIRHTGNLRRLAQGNENRLKDSAMIFELGKVLHVLAMGLWFGMVAFFTFVVGLSLFATFERLSVEPRPMWLPLPGELAGEPPSPSFPDPLRKEQGSRLAGAAVGPLFAWYYPIQAGCAFVAVVTALGWSRNIRRRVDRVRSGILLAAAAAVLIGWGLEKEVSRLRVKRNEASDRAILSQAPTKEMIASADAARARFGLWHFYSLIANFATLLLAMAGMALAAQLPQRAGLSAAPVNAEGVACSTSATHGSSPHEVST